MSLSLSLSFTFSLIQFLSLSPRLVPIMLENLPIILLSTSQKLNLTHMILRNLPFVLTYSEMPTSSNKNREVIAVNSLTSILYLLEVNIKYNY